MSFADNLLAQKIGKRSENVAQLVMAMLQLSNPSGHGLSIENVQNSIITKIPHIATVNVEDQPKDSGEITSVGNVVNADNLFDESWTAERKADNNITKSSVSEIFTHLARGIQYVHEKYGYSPSKLVVTEKLTAPDGSETKNCCCYHRESDSIIMTTEFIANMANAKRQKHVGNTPQTRTDLTIDQLLICVGVEEAFHSYQCQKMGDYYKKAEANQHKAMQEKGVENFYREDPLEFDAGVVVRNAINDMHLGDRPYDG